MIKLPAQKDAHEAPKTTSQLSNIIWYDNQSYQMDINLSTKGYWFTCIELRLVDIAASLDIQVKSRRPVSSPVCFLRGFLNESKWSVDGEKAGWAKSWGTWHCREAYNRSSRWVSTNAPRQEEKVWRKTHQQSLWQGILIVGYILYPGAGLNPIDGRVAEKYS